MVDGQPKERLRSILELAAKLRGASHPVILVVNKVDIEQHEEFRERIFRVWVFRKPWE